MPEADGTETEAAQRTLTVSRLSDIIIETFN